MPNKIPRIEFVLLQVENEKTSLLNSCEEQEDEVEAITAENEEECRRIGELEVCIFFPSILTSFDSTCFFSLRGGNDVQMQGNIFNSKIYFIHFFRLNHFIHNSRDSLPSLHSLHSEFCFQFPPNFKPEIGKWICHRELITLNPPF